MQRPKLHVVLSCAHTHSAPGFRENYGNDLNLAVFYQEIINKVCSAIEKATILALPAKLSYGERKLEGIGANRRDKSAPVNTILKVISLATEQNNIVVNFNCHPTLMGRDNLLISKDYQGAAMDELASDGFSPIFFQGACGDVSTRFTRQAQTFEDLARIGHLFAEAIKDQVKQATDLVVSSFAYDEHIFDIPKKQFKSEEYYLQEISRIEDELKQKTGLVSPGEFRVLETAVEGIKREYQFLKKQTEIVTSVTCGILRLGTEIAVVFLPFELFSKLADQIVSSSKYPHTIIVGYTFGSLGYLPDIDSFTKSGYEVTSCMYQQGAGEQVVEKVVELLNQ